MATKVRIPVEMEIHRFLYYLVGVKDARLQEINCEFHLGLSYTSILIMHLISSRRLQTVIV